MCSSDWPSKMFRLAHNTRSWLYRMSRKSLFPEWTVTAINTGDSRNPRYWFILQGGVSRKGYLRRRITVTLSIFNFSTCFLAQIEENRGGRLSKPFLGPGDIFSKSYDENQIRFERECARTPWSGGWWVTSRSQITSINVWQDCFRHNFSKNCPQDLKFV